MTEHWEDENREFSLSELSQRQRADLWRLGPEEPKGFHTVYGLDVF